MPNRDKLIPLAALAVFVLALIGILYGDRIGWNAMLGAVPSYVWLIVVVVVLAISFRIMPRTMAGNRFGWWLLIGSIVVAFIVGFATLFGGR